jgi:hypothetical protein
MSPAFILSVLTIKASTLSAGLPVDLHDHVARPKSGLVCRAGGGQGLDEQPGGSSCRPRELLRDRLDLQAEARPSDLLAGDQLAGDPVREVDRDREAQADASAGAVRNGSTGGVDADETRVAVDEGAVAADTNPATAVPMIQRRRGDGRALKVDTPPFGRGTERTRSLARPGR